jgi:hypothetical protein
MAKTLKKITLTNLLGSKIVTAEGRTIGHVADIQLTRGPEYQVKALLFGWSGWLHRLYMLNPFSRRKPAQPPAPKAILWDAVDSFDCSIVRLKPGFQVTRLEPEDNDAGTAAGER